MSCCMPHESFGKLKLLRMHEEFFASSLETLSLEELIDVVDKTISSAEEVLPPDLQTHKTVFGVKDDWVETESKKIKKDYLAKLKKLCDALDLTPIGFMVVTEAISHLLQQQEGAPLLAILGDLGQKTVTLSLFRGGKVAERIQGPLVGSAPATVDDLLKHFTAVVLPARLIIYDGKTTESLQQAFISHQWSKALHFLHVPQVTALSKAFDAKAITQGAAEQLGFEVIGMDLQVNEIKEGKVAEKEEAAIAEPATHENTEKDEPEAESKPETATSPISSIENFGFVTDQDIPNTPPQTLPRKATTEEIDTMEESNKQPISDNFSRIEEEKDEHTPKNTMTNIFGFLSSVKLPHITLPKAGGNKRFLLPIIGIVMILIFLGAFTAFYFNNVNAQIVLVVKPKMVNQEQKVIFSDSSGSNFSENSIAAKSLETTVDGSISTPTTGKKDVGEKAKGSVTIYNNADKSVSLDKDTQIKASNGVLFLLDKSVSVASASGDVFSGTKPGTVEVAVVAKDIGTEGNLPSGTKFTIGSTSTLAAKNDSAFSGGSKKQVQVVSKNDVAKLRVDLPKSLEGKAKETIAKEISGDETLLPFVTIKTMTKESLDNAIDKEAKNVKLTATVSFVGLSYQNNELTKYATFLFKEKYSQEINQDSIKLSVEEPEENDNEEIEATIQMEAGLLPDIDTADVVNKVENMSRKDALSYLSGLPQVAETKITFAPGIPFIFNLFPRLPNQISVEVKPE